MIDSPNTAWHWKVFAMTGLGILFAWSNGISGLVQAQLIEIGWADNNIAAVFSSLYSVGMLFGALVGGIIGENKGGSTIKNCVNTGVVAGYNVFIGGICGAK